MTSTADHSDLPAELTTNRAAVVTGISREHLLVRALLGDIRSRGVGGQIFLDRDDVLALHEKRKRRAQEKRARVQQEHHTAITA